MTVLTFKFYVLRQNNNVSLTKRNHYQYKHLIQLNQLYKPIDSINEHGDTVYAVYINKQYRSH